MDEAIEKSSDKVADSMGFASGRNSSVSRTTCLGSNTVHSTERPCTRSSANFDTGLNESPKNPHVIEATATTDSDTSQAGLLQKSGSSINSSESIDACGTDVLRSTTASSYTTESLRSSIILPISDRSYSPSSSELSFNICDLPECVLLRIYQWLDIKTIVLFVRKTCRLWHNLSYDRSLWKTLQLDNGGFGEKMGDASFLKMLAPIADLVEEITFGFTMLLSDESFMHKDIYCSKLTYLDFSLTNVTTNAIVYLTEKYPKLANLNLNHCSYINIYKCLDFVVKFQDLKYLSFEDFACPADDDKLNDKILNTFQNCRNVEGCDLYATELSDVTLAGIFECSPNLKEIDITGADKITVNGFKSLNKSVHTLTCLSIAYTMIDDRGLKVIAENSPKLKSLNIMSCICITDVGIGYVASNCKELEGLLVNKTDPEEKGCSITSSGLESIALGCRKLKILYVSYCLLMDDKCILAISENCPNLSKLRLAGCLSITDASLKALGKHSKYLRDLEVSECAQVTSTGVGFLMANCRWLQCLSLETCHRVDDINISKYRHLQDCDIVDDEAEFKEEDGIPEISSEASNMDTELAESLQTEATVSALAKMEDDTKTEDPEVSALPMSTVVEDSQISNDQHSTMSKILPSSENAIKVSMNRPEQSESLDQQQSPYNETEETSQSSKEGPLASTLLDDMDKILLSLQDHSHLQTLHLSFCSKVTNETIIEIAQNCPDLQELSLRGCHLITDVAIATLVRSCPLLRILDISGGSSFFSMKISSVALSAIAHDCKYIERLMVSKNKLINLSGLEVLFNKCTSLQSLELTVGEPMYASFTGVMSLINNVKDRIVKIANKVQVIANKQTGNLHIEFYPNPEPNRAVSAVYFSYGAESEDKL
ncbi:uncharacterized protein LOC126832400 [Patella vulgata]|uniref:uncharacterized protein LOC126832400 n=1 Tax=Patella vulgata TaxID=6465 RepID=UPI00218052F7|nr:uncharacterized protein LOC126832400 [Patella vulgata]